MCPSPSFIASLKDLKQVQVSTMEGVAGGVQNQHLRSVIRGLSIKSSKSKK